MRTGRTFTRLIALAAVTTLAACGQTAPSRAPSAPPDAPPAAWAGSLEHLATDADTDLAGTIAGLWAFADRFGQLTTDRGQNGPLGGGRAERHPGALGFPLTRTQRGAIPANGTVVSTQYATTEG